MASENPHSFQTLTPPPIRPVAPKFGEQIIQSSIVGPES